MQYILKHFPKDITVKIKNNQYGCVPLKDAIYDTLFDYVYNNKPLQDYVVSIYLVKYMLNNNYSYNIPIDTVIFDCVCDMMYKYIKDGKNALQI